MKERNLSRCFDERLAVKTKHQSVTVNAARPQNWGIHTLSSKTLDLEPVDPNPSKLSNDAANLMGDHSDIGWSVTPEGPKHLRIEPSVTDERYHSLEEVEPSHINSSTANFESEHHSSCQIEIRFPILSLRHHHGQITDLYLRLSDL